MSGRRENMARDRRRRTVAGKKKRKETTARQQQQAAVVRAIESRMKAEQASQAAQAA